MADTNMFVVCGNLTRDPESRQSQNGNTFVKGGIAVNSGFGDNQKANFFDFTVFGKSAETFAQYLTKGDKVVLQGRLDYQSWDSDEGKRSKIELLVTDFQMLGSKKSGSEEAAPANEKPAPKKGRPAKSQGSATPPPNDDEIPF